MPVRLEQVKRKGMRFNCLGLDHAAAQCPSKRRCRLCQARHHTLLQTESAPQTKETSADPPTVASAASQTTTRSTCQPRTILVLASSGSYVQSCRAQLDMGAMLSLITSKLANSLHAKKLKGTAVTISGIGGEQRSAAEVEIHLQSLYSSDYIDVRASVVDSIPMCATASKFQKVGQTPG